MLKLLADENFDNTIVSGLLRRNPNIDISTLIVSTPDTCGGCPRIADTRITVQYIVNEIKSGMTPEEIIEDKPYLTIAGIYTALAYYYANKESLNIEFTQYQEECQRLEAEYKTNYFRS